MIKRTITGIITALAFLVVIYILPDYTFVFCGWILALWINGEFLNAGKSKGISIFKKTMVVWTTILYIGIYMINFIPFFESYNYIIMYSIIGLFIINILAVTVLTGKYSLTDISYNIMGWFYTSFLLSFAILIRFEINGQWLLLFLLIGALITDIFAYYIGSLIGKHKIIPRISPKKTWEGSIGGWFFCAIFMFGYSYIFTLITGDVIGIWKVIIMGILSGALSQLGDWSASYVKRQLGIKDFGKLLPGHGGMLDRLDSILFLAPIIFLILNI